MTAIQAVLQVDNAVGECPRWNVTEQTLYWIDLANRQFFKYAPAAGSYQVVQLDHPVGCLAFDAAGGLILAGSNGFMRWQDHRLTRLQTDPGAPFPARLNDGAVDRAGRFWVGTASDQPDNKLYRLDSDGSLHVMETGITISNGIAWSPDNRTMYYSDSGGRGIVYAYAFELENGMLHNRRVFLPPTGTSAAADGLTVDAEGFVWIAFWDGWRVCRYDPAGRLVQTLPLPVQRPTSCTFGGPELNDLYITSASQGVDRREQPLAGSLFRVEVSVKGLVETMVSKG